MIWQPHWAWLSCACKLTDWSFAHPAPCVTVTLSSFSVTNVNCKCQSSSLYFLADVIGTPDLQTVTPDLIKAGPITQSFSEYSPVKVSPCDQSCSSSRSLCLCEQGFSSIKVYLCRTSPDKNGSFTKLAPSSKQFWYHRKIKMWYGWGSILTLVLH